MKRLSFILGVLCFVQIPVKGWAIGLEAAAGGWLPNPAGSFSYQALGESDQLDLERDAGYDRETLPFARAKIDMPVMLPNIYIMLSPMRFEATGRKDISFTFGNETYEPGVDFWSRLELNRYDLALFFEVPLIGTATLDRLSVELGLNARYIEMNAEVHQDDTGLFESASEKVLLPMGYAAALVKPVKWLDAGVELRGVAYGSTHYFDLQARVTLRSFAPFFFSLGWRHEDISLDEGGIDVSMDFSGPFTEAGFSF